MKITFLGTGAGEGYPGLYCECPNCTYAREHGGRNIRTNTATLLDDDTLLDMNDTCPVTAARLGISLARVRRLLITHSDDDHLSSQVLWWRFGGHNDQSQTDEALFALPLSEKMKRSAPRFTSVPTLDVYGNRATKHALMQIRPQIFDEPSPQQVAYHEIREGNEYVSGDVTFAPIRAQHGYAGFCHNYILTRGGKTLLYATDTGGYDEDMLAIVLSQKYDCVIMEGTLGLGASLDGHMSLEKNLRFQKLLRENGCWKHDERMYLTHMSPHWTPPHDQYVEMLADKGLSVAWDGLQIEI